MPKMRMPCPSALPAITVLRRITRVAALPRAKVRTYLSGMAHPQLPPIKEAWRPSVDGQVVSTQASGDDPVREKKSNVRIVELIGPTPFFRAHTAGDGNVPQAIDDDKCPIWPNCQSPAGYLHRCTRGRKDRR